MALASLSWLQWAIFLSSWMAWICDAVDFFTVTLSIKALGVTFEKPTTQITTAITLTLLFRPLGGFLFGILSDRYGRKWTLVANLLICGAMELGTGFVTTYAQFLGLRSLFGIAMGGIWGIAAATTLETLPVEVRGIASGLLQQGYAIGSLLATVINLTLVPENPHGWRALFWTAAGMSFFAAAVRMLLPESDFILRARQADTQSSSRSANRTLTFLHETVRMMKKHWLLAIYSVVLTGSLSFLAHGSQDLYPTFLETTKQMTDRQANLATITGNCGAVLGGVVSGATSQKLGRRITIALCVIIAGAFVPLWVLPKSFGALTAGAFFLQFGVQGALGVIPIYIAELSPPAFRTVFPGFTYQLGAAASGASAQIEATAGAHKTITLNGKVLPDYATVQGIMIGVIAAFTLIVIAVGPENRGSHFERHKAAFEEGGGDDDAYRSDSDSEVIKKGDKLEENSSSKEHLDKQASVTVVPA